MLRELELVLSSAGFSRNERQSQFLRFLVERHLEGRDSELKESVIAVEVFGRDPGYDPKLDGIVRTEAMRLRARLDKYYAAEGSRDPLIIELPKGGYRPVFRERPTPCNRCRECALGLDGMGHRGGWLRLRLRRARPGGGRGRPGPVTVAVLPFENQDQDPATDYFADGLTDEIIRNLSVIEGLTVPSRTSSFALKGKAIECGSRRVSSSGQITWSKVPSCTPASNCGSPSRLSGSAMSLASGRSDSIAS